MESPEIPEKEEGEEEEEEDEDEAKLERRPGADWRERTEAVREEADGKCCAGPP